MAVHPYLETVCVAACGERTAVYVLEAGGEWLRGYELSRAMTWWPVFHILQILQAPVCQCQVCAKIPLRGKTWTVVTYWATACIRAVPANTCARLFSRPLKQ